MNQKENEPAVSTSFDRDGFVVFPQFVTGEALVDLLENVQRFIQDIVPQLEDKYVFYEEKNVPSSLKQVQHMGKHDPWFHHFFHTGRFREVAEMLLHGPVVPKNMQYFNKPPRIGRPTPPHQDGFYFMLNPCEAVTMWFALEEVDEGNGCVRYVKGSHKQGMRKHTRTQTLGFSQGIVDYPGEADRENELALPANAGDLLVHDSLTIHRADGNQSLCRTRQALGFIYYSDRAREDVQAHSEYQKKLTEEMRASGKI
ncbi:MAG: phytanoyl-CoA dioxygenase family protein [Verrucomicrobia bacterium]|nr:phytanoyl-CoA dioxygenase family protein [Verrucomicrobiota bacterium]